MAQYETGQVVGKRILLSKFERVKSAATVAEQRLTVEMIKRQTISGIPRRRSF
jgi:hypothetical protein